MPHCAYIDGFVTGIQHGGQPAPASVAGHLSNVRAQMHSQHNSTHQQTYNHTLLVQRHYPNAIVILFSKVNGLRSELIGGYWRVGLVHGQLAVVMSRFLTILSSTAIVALVALRDDQTANLASARPIKAKLATSIKAKNCIFLPTLWPIQIAAYSRFVRQVGRILLFCRFQANRPPQSGLPTPNGQGRAQGRANTPSGSVDMEVMPHCAYIYGFVARIQHVGQPTPASAGSHLSNVKPRMQSQHNSTHQQTYDHTLLVQRHYPNAIVILFSKVNGRRPQLIGGYWLWPIQIAAYSRFVRQVGRFWLFCRFLGFFANLAKIVRK